MENFGKRLKDERERLGLNQTAFGEMAGVGRKSQFNYEAGERLPDAAYIEKIASFGVDVLYLLLGTRHENTANTPYEMAFLRNCRAFKDNDSRQMALNALVAMSGYKSSLNEEGAYPANEPSIRLVAEQPQTYGSEEK